MRTTVLASLSLAAALALTACGEDAPTFPSSSPASEFARGGGKGNAVGSGRIVFAHKFEDGYLDIYTMNPDGSAVTRLLQASGYSNWAPRWSPDQSRIVFVSNRTGVEKIFIMNSGGTGQKQLTDGGCADRYPSISPDGNKVAFQRACAGGGIFVVNVNGTGLTQVTTNSADLGPTWLPDGSRIIFSNSYESTKGIYRVKLDGTDRFPIEICPLIECRSPMFSPDGKRLAFWSAANGGQITIHTFADHSYVNLANLGMQSHYPPTFSPDGTKLIFTAGPYGMDYELWSVNSVDGFGLTRLTTMPGQDQGPSWSH